MCYCPSDLLLHVEPHNRQAQSLRGLIDAAETKEGYIGQHNWLFHGQNQSTAELILFLGLSGIGLVAGAAAVGGILVASLLKRARR
jgi:fission 1 protein